MAAAAKTHDSLKSVRPYKISPPREDWEALERAEPSRASWLPG